MNYRVLLAGVVCVTPAFAEERAYSLSIDGQPAGEVVFTFKRQADGSTTVACRSDGKILPPGPYRGRATEVWKDGRLVRLDASGVTVREAGRDYRLWAGAKDVTARGDLWPDTFAVRPGPDRSPLVVDVLTGDVSRAKVETVGPDRVTVAGKPIPTTRYRVTVGGRAVDLWFDQCDRLVRRGWGQDGARWVIECAQIAPK